jgi:hypothetical protein
MTVVAVSVSMSTNLVFLITRGELVGLVSRFFRAFPSVAAISITAVGAFFGVFFFRTQTARGDMAVSVVSTPAMASTATFLSAASRCFVKPSCSGEQP